jgi:hypothetical protein
MGVRLDNARFTTQYIGRYTKRPVLAQSRIKEYDGKYVTFEYEDKTEDERKPLRMSVEVFIARLVVHIHEKHFRAIRHYGIYATRTRKEDIALARTLLNEAAKPEAIPYELAAEAEALDRLRSPDLPPVQRAPYPRGGGVPEQGRAAQGTDV